MDDLPKTVLLHDLLHFSAGQGRQEKEVSLDVDDHVIMDDG